ncbi:MAG: hypothetical protein ABR522_02210 [Marinobacter sp.]
MWTKAPPPGIAWSPKTPAGDRYMQEPIPGAKNQPHSTLTGGHFLQEDSPVQFANAVNDLLKRVDGEEH